MDFFNDLITQKSWQTLLELKGKLKFVLIGGWAVYLYAKALKSKDIDIIVNYDQLEKLRRDFLITKNERLKKYEAQREQIQIDIYLPHYSNLGIPVEEILKETQKLETFIVPSIEMLLILKQYVYTQRNLSVKGQKDKFDILSLLTSNQINFWHYQNLLQKFQHQNWQGELRRLIEQTVKVPELGINQHAWSRRKKELLTALKI